SALPTELLGHSSLQQERRSESAAFYRKSSARGQSRLWSSWLRKSPRMRAFFPSVVASMSVLTNVAVLGFFQEQRTDNQSHHGNDDRIPQTVVDIPGCCD